MENKLLLKLKNKTNFSRNQLAIFVLVFALIGGVVLWKSFAAGPVIASIEGESMIGGSGTTTPGQTTNFEAETMSLPAGGSVISDASASGGSAIRLYDNGTATGLVSFPASVNSFTVSAKGDQCQGAPAMTVSIDGTNYLTNTAVSSTGWATYTATQAVALTSGSHTVSITFNNDYTQTKKKGHNQTNVCSRNLYVDKTVFNGLGYNTGGFSETSADSAASAGQELKMYANGTVTGNFTLPSNAVSMTVVAKADSCAASGANLKLSVDNNQLLSTTVNSTSLNAFNVNTNLNSGAHSMAITFDNDYYDPGVCDRNLYIDVTNFYGPDVITPKPTVALSASPTSVSAGGSSTLTWNSSNSNSCNASGAWSGAQSVSGSVSTGALNQSSTYTLTCTGDGGTVSSSATVVVSSSSIVNLALNHPATASSLETADFLASSAFDGNPLTRWSSAYSDPQWLEVDLGSTQTIGQVVLMWADPASAKAYQIQTSNDNVNWTPIYFTTNGQGGTETLAVSGSGRYVRMYGTQRASGYGYSIFEMQVMGTQTSGGGGTGGGGTGTLRFKHDYSTGDLSNWTTHQDDTTTANPDPAGFWWGHVSVVNNLIDGANRYAGKFALPAWNSGDAAFVNVGSEYPLQHPDEYYGLSYYFPSGFAEPQTGFGTMIWQKGKASPGDPMFGGSEPVMMAWQGEDTNQWEKIIIEVQSGAFPSPAGVSQWYSGMPPNDLFPGGIGPRYVGTNPFPAGGFQVVPHSMFAYNTWIHIVLHVHHSVGTDGAVEAWAKKATDATWTKTVPFTTGFPTLEWIGSDSRGPAGSISPYSKYDNVGAYTGELASPGLVLYNGVYAAGSSFDAVAAAVGN